MHHSKGLSLTLWCKDTPFITPISDTRSQIWQEARKGRLKDGGKKKVFVSEEGVAQEVEKIDCLQQQTRRRTLNVHDELHSLFHFQITLSHAFLDAILKNQGHNFHPICSLSLHEHWQIVIFWPRSQRRVVRGRRADKRLLPFTPAHYWAFRPRSTNPKAPRRGRSCCSCAHPGSSAPRNLWLTTAARSFSSKNYCVFQSIDFSFSIYSHLAS